MAHDLIGYVETRTPAHQWEANNAHSFELVSAPNNTPWPEMVPDVELTLATLAGLLMMGASKVAYPYSFGVRGCPSNASDEVKALFKDLSDKEKVTALTRQELEQKLGELMIIGDQKALGVAPALKDFIESLPPHSGDPTHQRVVLWTAQ